VALDSLTLKMEGVLVASHILENLTQRSKDTAVEPRDLDLEACSIAPTAHPGCQILNRSGSGSGLHYD
jgi:hypothetical protein